MLKFSHRRVLFVLAVVVAGAALLVTLLPKTSLSKPKWLTQNTAQSTRSESNPQGATATEELPTSTGTNHSLEPQAYSYSDGAPESCLEQHPDITPPLSPNEVLQRREDLNQREDRAHRLFRASRLPQYRVPAALLARNRTLKLDLLSEAVAANPNDVTILWHAFVNCTRNNSGGCPLAEWEDRLIKLDGQNSHVWMQIAYARLERGDADGALNAIQRAGTSAEHQNFDRATARYFRDAYVSTGLFSSSELMSLGVGRGRMQYSRSIRLFEDMCVTQSQDSIEWAESCLLYANAAIARDDHLESSHSAYRVRKIASVHFDDADQANKDHEDFKQRVARIEQRISNMDQLEGLILANPHLIDALLHNLSEYGELEGIVRSYDELTKFLPPEDRPECNTSMDSNNE